MATHGGSRFQTDARWFVILWSVAFTLFFFGFATKGTFDPGAIGSYWPGRYFSAQAEAMLDGRLWIEATALPGECFRYAGRCYGYFGLPPSILRLPLVAVLGAPQPELTALYLAIAAGITMWAALDLFRRALEQSGVRDGALAMGSMAVAAITLGPGGVLMLVSDAYVYQEAILWSVACTMVGVNLFWRWWFEGRSRQFAGAVIAVTLAAGSRPTSVLVGGTLAVGLVVARLMWQRLRWRTLAGAAALAVLPVIALVGPLLVKFGTPTPPWDTYEGRNFTYIQYNMSNNGGEFTSSTRFIPTATLMYLRPDAVSLQGQWPFVTYRFGRPFGVERLERITYLPPANRDSINVEHTVSLTNVMPIPLAATVAGAVAIVRRRRRRVELLIMLALLTPVAIMLTTPTIATRYLGDAYPLVAAGMAFSTTLLPRLRRAGPNTRRVILAITVGLTLISVPVALAMASQYNWTYRFGIQ
jgi:hypothetical protein